MDTTGSPIGGFGGAVIASNKRLLEQAQSDILKFARSLAKQHPLAKPHPQASVELQ